MLRCDAFAHAVQQHVALLLADADRVGEVGAGEALPGAQLEQQLVALAEPARRFADEVGELGALDLGTFRVRVVGGAHLRHP